MASFDYPIDDVDEIDTCVLRNTYGDIINDDKYVCGIKYCLHDHCCKNIKLCLSD